MFNVPAKSNSTCGSGFRCSSGSSCIPTHWVCDGEYDCKNKNNDDSDEIPPACSRKTLECSDKHFKCESATSNTLSRCINKDWRCDGVRDCTDGTDEEGCTSFTNKTSSSGNHKDDLVNSVQKSTNNKEWNEKCKKGQFFCGDVSSQCINESLVCNDRSDCDNGMDEPVHCGTDECRNQASNFCSQKCIDLQVGYTCDCNDGFELDSNGFSCNG